MESASDVSRKKHIARSERAFVLHHCSYALLEKRGTRRLKFREGEALSLNVSPGGMLLLMSHRPQRDQILEIYKQSPDLNGADHDGEGLSIPARESHERFSWEEQHDPSSEAQQVSLVEVRWTKPLLEDTGGETFLVGVRFLLNPVMSS